MAGGTFNRQNKVRPGAYINVFGRQNIISGEGTSGVVLLPMELNWGPEGVPVKVKANTNMLQTFGHDIGDPEMITLHEALRNASQVIVVRVSTGVKAKTASLGAVEAESLYSGTAGNNINLKVFVKPVGLTSQLIIETYLRVTRDGVPTDSLVYTQGIPITKDESEEWVIPTEIPTDNPYVELTKINSIPTVEATITLTGGTTVPHSANNLSQFLTIMETEEFNLVAWPFEDTPVPVVNAVMNLRDNAGVKVQAVVAKPVAQDETATVEYDSEAVIVVPNGVTTDNSELSPYEVVAWVAGASAKAGVSASLTYTAYPGSTGATPKYSHEKTIELLEAGYFLFTDRRGVAVVEQDINSLVTLGGQKNQSFKKNRVIRTLDFIANDSKRAFEDNFIGQVNNTVDGRELFKADRISAFDSLQGQGAIQDFTPEDIEVGPGEQREGVVLNVGIFPVDAMEKLYMSIEVL